MENVNNDFTNLALIDTGLYSNEGVFYEFFRRHNITSVAQLLDDDLVTYLKTTTKTALKEELSGLVEVLRYKYLNAPLPQLSTLDQKVFTENFNGYLTLNINFRKLGFARWVNHYAMLYAEKIENNKIDKSHKDILLVDFLRNSLQNSLTTSKGNKKTIVYKNIATIYLEAYYNKNITNINQLYQLREQLEKAILMRDQLDEQIAIISEKIDTLLEEEQEKNLNKCKILTK